MGADIVCPVYADLSFALKISATINPAIKAAVIPDADASSPPENIPINPFSSTASRTPFASKCPKPDKGTETNNSAPVKTGDTSAISQYMMLALGAITVMMLCVLVMKRANEQE